MNINDQRVNAQQYFKGMHEYFKLPIPGDYLDLSALKWDDIQINIIKFDDWLHKQVGDYESHKMNMDEALVKHYGQEASDFIKRLL
jgi:hypothetical protein